MNKIKQAIVAFLAALALVFGGLAVAAPAQAVTLGGTLCVPASSPYPVYYKVVGGSGLFALGQGKCIRNVGYVQADSGNYTRMLLRANGTKTYSTSIPAGWTVSIASVNR